jgi:hypothetical protein
MTAARRSVRVRAVGHSVSMPRTTVRLERGARRGLILVEPGESYGPPPADPEEAALLYELLIDGVVVGTLADGETQVVDVEPGDHTVAVRRDAAELSISEIRFTAHSDPFFDEHSMFTCRGGVLDGPIRIQSHSVTTVRNPPSEP